MYPKKVDFKQKQQKPAQKKNVLTRSYLLAHKESLLFPYEVTCQYVAVDVATTKVIVCYLGMLFKCKTTKFTW